MTDSVEHASDTTSMMESQLRLGDYYEAAYHPRLDAGLMPQTENDEALNEYLEAAKGPADRPSDLENHRLLDILKHQQQLERSVALLATSREGDAARDCALLACSRSLAMLRRFVVAGLGSDPLKTLPTQISGRVAEKVFAVPELTEMILMELSPARLLRVAPVCKAFEAAIASSPALRDKLGLRAHENSIWKSPFNCRGPDSTHWRSVAERDEVGEVNLDPLRESLRCYILDTEKARSRAVKEHVATVRAVFVSHTDAESHDRWSCRSGSRALPIVGDRGQAILICQPPIKEMFILASCCRTRLGTRSEPLAPTVTNPKGLTVGDLLHATSWGMKQHRLCSYAKKADHYHTGMVDCRISFEGTVQLQTGDPFLPLEMRPEGTGTMGDGRDYSEYGEATPYSRDESIESRVFWGQTPDRNEIDDYIDYKREARARGEEIPTLAEFQAWQAEESQRGDEEEHEDRDRPQEVY
ncbi:hypothetical protein LTR56_000192 [Elasticomyces elasticus]|nr:hypothetical protein LTR56_000192 [Elasticomyces elasticus]KAK3667180.1 hypothetical protein LTR22_002045 [Elasticomyces elasticus]KAK4932954.1 hypothetical protein LTR49_000911 [Elasticomyces elasticus]